MISVDGQSSRVCGADVWGGAGGVLQSVRGRRATRPGETMRGDAAGAGEPEREEDEEEAADRPGPFRRRLIASHVSAFPI